MAWLLICRLSLCFPDDDGSLYRSLRRRSSSEACRPWRSSLPMKKTTLINGRSPTETQPPFSISTIRRFACWSGSTDEREKREYACILSEVLLGISSAVRCGRYDAAADVRCQSAMRRQHTSRLQSYRHYHRNTLFIRLSTPLETDRPCV